VLALVTWQEPALRCERAARNITLTTNAITTANG